MADSAPSELSVDLEKIWDGAVKALTFEHFQALQAAGVSPGALASAVDYSIGYAEIGVVNGKWRPEFRGRPAIVLPEWAHTAKGHGWWTDPDGDDVDVYLADLIAFPLNAPRTFWPMVGAVPALNFPAIEVVSYYGRALPVHETPLDWLKAGSEGVVILETRHYWPLILDGIPHLIANNRKFASQLLERLERPVAVPDVMFKP